MSRTSFLAGLPLIQTGNNKGRLDRPAAALVLGITEAQLSKAYNNWIQIFRIPGSDLTFMQYIGKMKNAGITPCDVGTGREKYHLSRFNDVGPYTKDSCRFIKSKENRAEQYNPGILVYTLRKYGWERTQEILSENGVRNSGNLKHQTYGPAV